MDNTHIDAVEPVGHLTKSGKLYEGNYPEWAERISAILEELYGGVEPDYSFLSPDTIDPRDVVLSEVSPAVRSRLPDLLPTNVQPDEFGGWPTLELAKELVSRHLKKVAQPFRLMDLPLELRKDIEELAISARSGELRWPLVALLALHQRRRLHPMTRVSRKMREETLEPAWGQVRLCIDEYDSTRLLAQSGNMFFNTVHNILNPFYGSQDISHLRSASLYLRVRRIDAPDMPTYATFQLRFTYTPRTGLDLEVPDHKYHALTRVSVLRLKVHVERVSQSLRSDILGGGSLVAALTAVPGLWQDGSLLCVQRLRVQS